MADLQTTYMGLKLANPIIAGASRLTSKVDGIKKLADAGAGAVVLSSLFEEQIQLERARLEEDRTRWDEMYAEMTSMFPHIEHAGPEEHLALVRKAKEAAGVPIIASLNAITPETWVEYAQRLAEAGADALELNFYATPTDLSRPGREIEAEQVSIAQQVRRAVSVPISAKLSPFYANPLNVIARLDKAGVKGFVLFNRFFQPDIDIKKEANTFPLSLSHEGDYGLSLRYAGLLYGQIKADICASTGITTGEDVAKLLLAGAGCVQVVTTLYKNGADQLGKMKRALEAWMEGKGYATLADFRGKLARANQADPWAYERAQYVRTLLRPNPLD